MRRLLAFASSVVLVETIFFSALAPLLPTFEEDFGLSKSQVGLLVGMYAIGGVAGAIPGGWMSSRLGIRPTAILGLCLVAATCVGFGLAESYVVLCVARFGQGFASSLCWNASFAWIVAESPRERRGEMLGIAMGAAVFGALIGPAVGGAASVLGRAAVFGGLAGLALVLAVWAALLPKPRQGEVQPVRLLLDALRSRRILAGMWLLMMPALLFGTVGTLAPLQLDEVGWGTLGISLTFIVAAAIEALVNPAVGRWSDRSGRLAPIRFGLIASTVGALTIPWVNQRVALSIVVICASVAFGALLGAGDGAPLRRLRDRGNRGGARVRADELLVGARPHHRLHRRWRHRRPRGRRRRLRLRGGAVRHDLPGASPDRRARAGRHRAERLSRHGRAASGRIAAHDRRCHR